MVAERFQNRIDTLLSPIHGAEHVFVAGFGLSESCFALPAQVRTGILAKFGFPFREERVGHAFDVFDAFPHCLGTVFAALQFAIQWCD